MESKGLISVIVPVYNAQEYLKKCLDSVLEQTYSNWELFVIDDGSIDQSLAVCQEYAKKDSRIQVLHQENAGVSAARNLAIDLAQGEFLCFLDADDWILPGLLESLLQTQREHGAQLVVTGYSKVDPLKGEKKDWPAVNAVLRDREFFERFGELYDKTLLSGPCFKLYENAVIQREGIRFDPALSLGEDLTFNLQYYEFCKTVCLVEDCLYCYRTVADTSLTTRFNPQKSALQFQLYQKVREFCRRHDCLEQSTPYLNAVFFRQSYLQLQSLCAAPLGRRERDRLMRDVLKQYMTAEFLAQTQMQSLHNRLVRWMMRRRAVHLLGAFIKMKDALKHRIRR